MAACSFCGSTIVLGGKKDGDRTYCNDKCLQLGALVRIAEQFPDAEIRPRVLSIHQGRCPRCQGPGPVDIHTSYRVWSALFFTSWANRPQMSCRSCGTRGKIGDVFFCLFLGWWGFPWGLIMTPVQIVRNLAGLTSNPDPTRPSDALTSMVKANLAAKYVAAQRAAAEPARP